MSVEENTHPENESAPNQESADSNVFGIDLESVKAQAEKERAEEAAARDAAAQTEQDRLNQLDKERRLLEMDEVMAEEGTRIEGALAKRKIEPEEYEARIAKLESDRGELTKVTTDLEAANEKLLKCRQDQPAIIEALAEHKVNGQYLPAAQTAYDKVMAALAAAKEEVGRLSSQQRELEKAIQREERSLAGLGEIVQYQKKHATQKRELEDDPELQSLLEEKRMVTKLTELLRPLNIHEMDFAESQATFREEFIREFLREELKARGIESYTSKEAQALFDYIRSAIEQTVTPNDYSGRYRKYWYQQFEHVSPGQNVDRERGRALGLFLISALHPTGYLPPDKAVASLAVAGEGFLTDRRSAPPSSLDYMQRGSDDWQSAHKGILTHIDSINRLYLAAALGKDTDKRRSGVAAMPILLPRDSLTGLKTDLETHSTDDNLRDLGRLGFRANPGEPIIPTDSSAEERERITQQFNEMRSQYQETLRQEIGKQVAKLKKEKENVEHELVLLEALGQESALWSELKDVKSKISALEQAQNQSPQIIEEEEQPRRGLARIFSRGKRSSENLVQTPLTPRENPELQALKRRETEITAQLRIADEGLERLHVTGEHIPPHFVSDRQNRLAQIDNQLANLNSEYAR